MHVIQLLCGGQNHVIPCNLNAQRLHSLWTDETAACGVAAGGWVAPGRLTVATPGTAACPSIHCCRLLAARGVLKRIRTIRNEQIVLINHSEQNAKAQL